MFIKLISLHSLRIKRLVMDRAWDSSVAACNAAETWGAEEVDTDIEASDAVFACGGGWDCCAAFGTTALALVDIARRRVIVTV
jgi:hypothetical protein